MLKYWYIVFVLTFTADFDWEEEHEKLAELEEDPGKNFANKTRDSGYYPTDRSYRSQEVGKNRDPEKKTPSANKLTNFLVLVPVSAEFILMFSQGL